MNLITHSKTRYSVMVTQSTVYSCVPAALNSCSVPHLQMFTFRANPESNVALMTLADLAVLVTLTTDSGKILAKLHQVHCTLRGSKSTNNFAKFYNPTTLQVSPTGEMRFISGIKIAHLALKHRQGKNHKTRIVAFVGSPIEADEKEMIKLAKKLKKEKVICRSYLTSQLLSFAR